MSEPESELAPGDESILPLPPKPDNDARYALYLELIARIAAFSPSRTMNDPYKLELMQTRERELLKWGKNHDLAAAQAAKPKAEVVPALEYAELRPLGPGRWFVQDPNPNLDWSKPTAWRNVVGVGRLQPLHEVEWRTPGMIRHLRCHAVDDSSHLTMRSARFVLDREVRMPEPVQGP